MKSRKKNLLYLESYSNILKENVNEKLKNLENDKKVELFRQKSQEKTFNKIGISNRPKVITSESLEMISESAFEQIKPNDDLNLKIQEKIKTSNQKASLMETAQKDTQNESNLFKTKSVNILKKPTNPGLKINKSTIVNNQEMDINIINSTRKKSITFTIPNESNGILCESQNSQTRVNQTTTNYNASNLALQLRCVKGEFKEMIENNKYSTSEKRESTTKRKLNKKDEIICRKNFIGQIYYNALINTNYRKKNFNKIKKKGSLTKKINEKRVWWLKSKSNLIFLRQMLWTLRACTFSIQILR